MAQCGYKAFIVADHGARDHGVPGVIGVDAVRRELARIAVDRRAHDVG